MNSLHFHQVEPTLENYWRSIILFGRNVATYKFALAKALLQFRGRATDAVTLEELALPFANQICNHLKLCPKQSTSSSSTFLNTCRDFNAGKIDAERLRDVTVRLGFNNVIDAFHVVNQAPVEKRFFVDERSTGQKIRLTENLSHLCESPQFQALEPETEARWRLVETAWDLAVSSHAVQVHYDDGLSCLYTLRQAERVALTSCKDSLNGYQKGRCFYCFRGIGLAPGAHDLADVDHFIPWILNCDIPQINGVWNLVLACQDCNRGTNGKFARVPTVTLLERLHRRNEYLIASHHPLRETLIGQTGETSESRASFLNSRRTTARTLLIHEWEPPPNGVALL